MDFGDASSRMKRGIGWAEHKFERLIFWTRWMLAPAYVVLCICIFVLVWKTIEELLELLLNLHLFAQTRAISQVLAIVDLVLVINLVLMIVFVGYHHFVSDLRRSGHKKSRIGRVG
jgi:uncharacterized protein (TIGR00645 family)